MMHHDRTGRLAMNEEGFTIVELLVAVVILVFVSIALLQTAVVNIEFNAKNAIRDEGVKLAGEKLNEMRNIAITNVADAFNVPESIEKRRVRNMSIEYTVFTNVSTVGTDNRKLETRVSWKWKGEPFETKMTTIR